MSNRAGAQKDCPVTPSGPGLFRAERRPYRRRVLRFPRAFWIASLCVVVLASPALLADFYADDVVAVLRLEGLVPDSSGGPFRLYTFASGEPGQRERVVDHGPLPWWTSDGLRLSFFRPLSSALLAVDHALGGRNPLGYHVHSVVWYLAAVLAAGALLRRLLPEREAAVALLLFAVSPAHWMLATWPSARHVAVSGTFALLALLLHLRARQAGRRARVAWVGALVCGALGLMGGETGLGLFAYVVAYEAFGRSDAVSLRLRALVPWGALLVVYGGVYKALGFGVRDSGGYVDPAADPGRYLAQLPSRLAVLADAALLGVPSEVSGLAPRAAPVLAAMGVVATVAFALLLRRALRVLDARIRRTMTWLLVGAVLAAFPGAAGLPGDRVLFMSNLGITAALALVLLHAGSKGPGTALAALPARAGVGLFALVHVVLAPAVFAFDARLLATQSHAAMAAASSAEIPAREGVHVVGIGLSDPLVGMYLGATLWLAPRADPRPRIVQLLSMSGHDHRVKRTDPRTLEIEVMGGALLEGAFESVVRSPDAPLRAGDVIPLGAESVEILDDDHGRPTRFAVTLDRPVDDPAIALVVWRDGGLRALAPPAVGEEVLLKHEVGPMGL